MPSHAKSAQEFFADDRKHLPSNCDKTNPVEYNALLGLEHLSVAVSEAQSELAALRKAIEQLTRK